MDATAVCLDQTKQSVRVEPRATWVPENTRPSVALSGQRDWACVLCAITEGGDRLFSRVNECVTAEHAKQFPPAVCDEFHGDVIGGLDGASYFRASTVTDLAARDDLEFVRLPAHSPELNPVEGCWRQVKENLSNDCLSRSTTSRRRLTTLSSSCRSRI
jgi:hypothetical protein